MASVREPAKLDAKARQGETVMLSGKSLEAQEHITVGRGRGVQTRRQQQQIERYQEMGHKGGLSTMDTFEGECSKEQRV
ncbi:Late embryogenesis abundant protein [Quillaja saponaria]|uniref:Late embryogenesis abundant protein n=1 Tax=Quillaja saponaria TaxID=32244 RepID=A0AAD7L2F2_QUISA|nr:Late embryogenesis abundant protein [Quillaja saponaria]